MDVRQYKAIVIGVSAGGLAALAMIIPSLPADLELPVIIVQHLHPSSNLFHVEHLNELGPLRVKEAEDKEMLQPGVVYFAPADYHLLIERDGSLSLSHQEKVLFSRPSIDVLFESAATAYEKKLIGIILTGANEDGAAGLAKVKRFGGVTIVQNPQSAEIAFMPKAAIAASKVDYILDLEDIAALLGRSRQEIKHG